MSVEDRFWRLVREADDLSPAGWSGCWLRGRERGYGTFRLGGRGSRKIGTHRFAYEFVVGVIPAGLTIDHLCERRECVNPAHMEVAPLVANMMRGRSPAATNARKTHCSKGHALEPPNVYVPPGARQRRCRRCDAERDRRRDRTGRLR